MLVASITIYQILLRVVKLLIKQVVIFITVKQLAKSDNKKQFWTTPAEFPLPLQQTSTVTCRWRALTEAVGTALQSLSEGLAVNADPL